LTQPSNWSRPQPTNTHRNRRRKHHSPINLELLMPVMGLFLAARR
jgi:hypothetical protein